MPGLEGPASTIGATAMEVAPGRMRQPDRRDSKVDLGIHHAKSRGCKIRLRIRELDIRCSAVLKEFSSHSIRFLGGNSAAPTPLDCRASVYQRLPVLRDFGENGVLGASASSLSFRGTRLEPAPSGNCVRDTVDLPSGLQPDKPGSDEAVLQGVDGGIRVCVVHGGDTVQPGKDTGVGGSGLVFQAVRGSLECPRLEPGLDGLALQDAQILTPPITDIRGEHTHSNAVTPNGGLVHDNPELLLSKGSEILGSLQSELRFGLLRLAGENVRSRGRFRGKGILNVLEMILRLP